jgi:nucleoside-diphosphate-sugar epimerase
MQSTRRTFLLEAAIAAHALACGSPATRGGTELRAASPSRPMPKKILILGGTRFLGPELVEAAQQRGHTLTLFNRGKTNPGLFPNIEKLHGDRDAGTLDALRGRTWDVVIDTSGYYPRAVKASAELLAGASQYVFVSSVSVYDKPPATGVDETAPVGRLEDPTVEKVDEKTYGPLKAACERAAEAAMPGKVTVVRPGLIVGPGDGSDRFTYWPVRLHEGGEVLAPGTPSDPVQLIDVRDLAEWIIRACERHHVGIFNAAGPEKAMGVGEMLARTDKAVGGGARFTWVDAKFLAEKKVEAWSDMPVWVEPTGEDAGIARVSSARAIAKGLTFRPLEATAKDTLSWWLAQPEERRKKRRAGLDRAREAEVLAAWHARGGAR